MPVRVHNEPGAESRRARFWTAAALCRFGEAAERGACLRTSQRARQALASRCGAAPRPGLRPLSKAAEGCRSPKGSASSGRFISSRKQTGMSTAHPCQVLQCRPAGCGHEVEVQPGRRGTDHSATPTTHRQRALLPPARYCTLHKCPRGDTGHDQGVTSDRCAATRRCVNPAHNGAHARYPCGRWRSA
jgi:hypothetical protein